MTEFVQIHILKVVPASNANRDGDGKPKTMKFGGDERARWSSQSMKQAVRQSDVFKKYFDSTKISKRSRKFGQYIYQSLITRDQFEDCLNGVSSDPKNPIVDEKTADAVTRSLVNFLIGSKSEKEKAKVQPEEQGESDKSEPNVNVEDIVVTDDKVVANKYLTSALCVLSWREMQAIGNALRLVTNKDPDILSLLNKGTSDENTNKSSKKSKDKNKTHTNDIQKKLDILSHEETPIDVAMSGRMMPSHPAFNVEAAIQVAHALGVQRVARTDDWFTAVDDLNTAEDTGSAHLDSCGFESSVMYIYINVNRDLLKANENGDENLVQSTLKAIAEGMMTVSPTGKQNSFAHNTPATYVFAVKGCNQPYNLAEAFLNSIEGKDVMAKAEKALNNMRTNLEKKYGKFYTSSLEFNVYDDQNKNTLTDLLNFVSSPDGFE